MNRLFVILGNGFSIDFLNHFSSIDDSIKGKIDVCNLFRLGDSINPPWTNSPGFLSFKITPELWKLGARTTISTKESAALIEEIITCANMYFDFICKPKQQEKRLKMQEDEHLYLKAYSELLSYLRHLFIYYNELVSQKSLENFVQSDSSWGWLKFFKKIHMEKKFERIVFVTYNYDIWLERLLTIFDIPYSIYGFDNPQDSIVEIIKPHGSISFVPQEESLSNYGINYSLNFEDLPLEDFKIQFENLDSASHGAMIPPAGDSGRLHNTDTWAKTLRERAEEAAKAIESNDNVILCGLSYGYVDRKELDGILLNLNQECNFTFINPNPPRDLNAVLMTIFRNYVLLSSSRNVVGVC